MKYRKTVTAMLLALEMMFSIGSYAATGNGTPASTTSSVEMSRLENRLEEIKSMDIENMPRSEKRKYAKEVKQIQKKMNAVGGGVYISAGALLVIVILLIVLL